MFLSKDYLAGAGSLPLVSAVYVEAVVGQEIGGFTIDSLEVSRFVMSDTAYLSPRPIGVVAYVDLASPDAAGELDKHTKICGAQLKGIRMIMNHSPTWPQIAHDRFMIADGCDPSAAAFDRGLSLLAPRGLSFDLHTNPHQFLGTAASLQRAPPGTAVVINHLGCLKLSGDASADAPFIDEWKTGMRALAAYPGMHVKLSGLEYIVKGWLEPASKERKVVSSLVHWVLAEFGASRVMAASNFPVDIHMGGAIQTMPTLFAALYAIVSPILDKAQLKAVFHDNAVRFYKLGSL